jgi:hypothetical protein
MNKNNIRLWVNALRSGEYEQTCTQLRDNNGFCCLGVATDVAIKHGVPLKWDEDLRIHRGVANHPYIDLPPEVVDWLDIGRSNPQLRTLDGPMKCTTANDDRGMTFDDIADAIESTYLGDNG